MNLQNNKLAIRFLRQGFVSAEKPEGFDEMSQDEMTSWAQSVLNDASDQELIEAMADFENTAQNGYFDETPDVQAIQEPENFDTSNENIVATPLWIAFSDPDNHLEMFEYENKHMGEFIQSLGFSLEQLSDIANGSSPDSLTMARLLNVAKDKAIDNLRHDCSEKHLIQIKNDDNAPAALKELVDKQEIKKIGFEKIINSPDYMPEHCVYVYMEGKTIIGVRTEEKSGSWDDWDDLAYTHMDHEIIDERHFHATVNEEKLLDREISSEEGIEAYRYLMKMTDGIDRELFRSYLLERDC